jgi:serine/threonine protein kinase
LENEYFSVEKMANYFIQGLKIISYFHNVANIYYGDFKPANLLLFRDEGIKIGDFGISIKI